MSLLVPNIIIYGGAACPNCIKAKQAVELLNLSYNYIDIGSKELGEWATFFDDPKNKIPSSHRSVPIIFINDEFLGGYSQLCTYLNNYELNCDINLTDDF